MLLLCICVYTITNHSLLFLLDFIQQIVIELLCTKDDLGLDAERCTLLGVGGMYIVSLAEG